MTSKFNHQTFLKPAAAKIAKIRKTPDYIGSFKACNKMNCIFFLLVCCCSALNSSDFVIELWVTDADNKYWETKNQMHMTIGHIKNIDQEKFEKALDAFNNENKDLIVKSSLEGFRVEFFNTNGFGNGYHILAADSETTARFALINSKLYDYLFEQFGALTDKTTPKTINPKGYTPHIEFLESNPERIPVKGDKIQFKDHILQLRKLK